MLVHVITENGLSVFFQVIAMEHPTDPAVDVFAGEIVSCVMLDV